MELDGRRQEGLGHFLVQVKGCRYHGQGELLEGVWHAYVCQMLAQDAVVDRRQGILARETQRKHAEVTLSKEQMSKVTDLKFTYDVKFE